MKAPQYSDLSSDEKEKIYNISMLLKKKYEKFQHFQVHGRRNTSTSTRTQPCAALLVNVNVSSHDSKDMG